MQTALRSLGEPLEATPSRVLPSALLALWPHFGWLRLATTAVLALVIAGASWIIERNGALPSVPGWMRPREAPNHPEVASRTDLASESPSSAHGALVIDDFEDEDLVPSDARFARWQRYLYSAPDRLRVAVWAAREGDGSNGSLRLDWMLDDEPNGKHDWP